MLLYEEPLAISRKSEGVFHYCIGLIHFIDLFGCNLKIYFLKYTSDLYDCKLKTFQCNTLVAGKRWS